MLKSNNRLNKNKPKIYLDHASSTPVDEQVLKAMNKIAKENYANSGAIHTIGLESKKILDISRNKIAKIIGAHRDEIIFTSGSTESNNLAILGIEINKNSHIITTNIEHASVLEVCKNLSLKKNIEVTFIPVEINGIVDPAKIKKALRPNTILVSVMYANNEIGTIQPIREISKIIRNFNKFNNKRVLFHSDATQAVNYLDINVQKLGVDLLSFNGAKIYGPKGVGVLYVKKGIILNKITFGGEQEFDLRPGTENLPAIAGLVKALEITHTMKEKESKRLIVLRDYFFNKLKDIGVTINGDEKNRLPNNVNITILRIPSDLLMIELDARGIYVSEKSACKSGDKSPSHVIKALRPENGANTNSLRFSLGRSTKKSDLDFVIKTLNKIIKKLESWY